MKDGNCDPQTKHLEILTHSSLQRISRHPSKNVLTQAIKEEHLNKHRIGKSAQAIKIHKSSVLKQFILKILKKGYKNYFLKYNNLESLYLLNSYLQSCKL